MLYDYHRCCTIVSAVYPVVIVIMLNQIALWLVFLVSQHLSHIKVSTWNSNLRKLHVAIIMEEYLSSQGCASLAYSLMLMFIQNTVCSSPKTNIAKNLL